MRIKKKAASPALHKQHDQICFEVSSKNSEKKILLRGLELFSLPELVCNYICCTWDQGELVIIKIGAKMFPLTQLYMHCRAPYAALYNCQTESGCVFVLHPCWHMLTWMLKENEGQGLMHAWIFLITVSHLSRLSTVSCVPRAANSQTRQWNPNLIFSTQKAFAAPHQALLLLFTLLLHKFSNWGIFQNINGRVFKYPWHMTSIMK